jgi:hypothetical protein
MGNREPTLFSPDLSGADRLYDPFAQKGALYAQVDVAWEGKAESQRIGVFLTHTQASNSSDERYARIRKSPLVEIRDLMGKHKPNHAVQILLGDLNVDAGPTRKKCYKDGAASTLRSPNRI